MSCTGMPKFSPVVLMHFFVSFDSPALIYLHSPFGIIRLRNPFRFALDPNAAKEEGKTRFFINDVGRHTWESVHEGGDGFAGANYGYPEREGKILMHTLFFFID